MNVFTTLDGGTYTAHPYEGPQPGKPEDLIAAISAITGWNLDLAEPVTDGKGGMTVCFDAGSCIFQGPPDPQKDEYHVFDSQQMIEAALCSVQYTLQMWASPTRPDSVPIYFCTGGGCPIVIEGVCNIPADQPYRKEMTE